MTDHASFSQVQGRSIRMFLVDGTPSGLITAEIMNWTGHALSGPRSKLAELVKRSESGRTGVYFLIGTDPENSARPLVYIGESDDVGKRLKQHNQPEGKGGKDFWEKVCLITSKDQNLTKAHIRYLESQLIRIARESGRCGLLNKDEPDFSLLPEGDLADMAFFIEQIRTILPVLGVDFLRNSHVSQTEITSAPFNESACSTPPSFIYSISKHGITARAIESDGDFVVLAGSLAQSEWKGSTPGYKGLFDQLVEDGVLQNDRSGLKVFVRDHAFSATSPAAAIIAGRNTNGRMVWKLEGSDQTYGDWQSAQMEAESETD